MNRFGIRKSEFSTPNPETANGERPNGEADFRRVSRLLMTFRAGIWSKAFVQFLAFVGTQLKPQLAQD